MGFISPGDPSSTGNYWRIIQNTLSLRLENFSSKMINHRKITREGLKPSEMSAESKLALRAMRRAGKKVVEDYRRLGLKLVVTDKDGKMVMRDA
jgi:hypothetical protein